MARLDQNELQRVREAEGSWFTGYLARASDEQKTTWAAVMSDAGTPELDAT